MGKNIFILQLKILLINIQLNNLLHINYNKF